jgi:hypothetical protein
MNFKEYAEPTKFEQGEDTLVCPICNATLIDKDGYNEPCDCVQLQYVSDDAVCESIQHLPEEILVKLEAKQEKDNFEEEEFIEKYAKKLKNKGARFVVLELQGCGCSGPGFTYYELFAFKENKS